MPSLAGALCCWGRLPPSPRSPMRRARLCRSLSSLLLCWRALAPGLRPWALACPALDLPCLPGAPGAWPDTREGRRPVLLWVGMAGVRGPTYHYVGPGLQGRVEREAPAVPGLVPPRAAQGGGGAGGVGWGTAARRGGWGLGVALGGGRCGRLGVALG